MAENAKRKKKMQVGEVQVELSKWICQINDVIDKEGASDMVF